MIVASGSQPSAATSVSLPDEPPASPARPAEVRRIEVSDLNAWFGSIHVLKDVSMTAKPQAVTAVIGPSGCGKSTFVRCLNRMHEEVRGAKATGKVLFDGLDIYGDDIDPVEIRRRIGDLAGAEEAFGRAHGLGFEPQPGLALLRLDQGKVEAAATALRVAVAGERGNQLRRARLLAAQVDVALAAGDLGTAGPAAAKPTSMRTARSG